MIQSHLNMPTSSGPEVPAGWENDPIVQRLVSFGPVMGATEVAIAFDVERGTVNEWITSLDLPATDCGSKEKPYWKILRRDAIAFRIARHTLTRLSGSPTEKHKKGPTI